MPREHEALAARLEEGRLVCLRCGLRVISGERSDGSTFWKHATGGKAGKTPAHRKHAPEPVTPQEVSDAL